MRKLDDAYIGCGLLWLAFGMAFGIWMGVAMQLNFSNSHAHANLLGFVSSILFGLILRAYPSMRESRLALPQFVVYQLGAVLLVIGKMQIDAGGEPTLAKIGALIILLGALGMLCLFALRRNAPVRLEGRAGRPA
ncbi:hypothetical protein [Sinorhizobium sp. BG8]|uniref:hypothetical protein n=1 Tax=Sinorhizobium sp. BG8 TaxID=2613773 RepID=UPI00193D711C|nr:hypothetical protein [Sinorhizobium sp. BG8]QRM53135.1 hypothetical protein F3Y30_00065 [Sinorhizobium sp. BG8]QRM56726.1 hypothetical protein F3Y30_20940 [Sinorhizobium sp. BG8]